MSDDFQISQDNFYRNQKWFNDQHEKLRRDQNDRRKRKERERERMMTVQKVLDLVEKIRQTYDDEGDNERTHGEEDKLHQAVLSAIANGTCDDPAGCAKAALRTKEIDFDRWCG